MLLLIRQCPSIIHKLSKAASLKSVTVQLRRCSSNDWNHQKLRRMKRLFSLALFTGTLATAWWLKKKKRQEFKDTIQHGRLLPEHKFGDLQLYQFSRFIIPEPIVKIWPKLKRFSFRPEDILIIAFPKTGITWLQEIVWLLANDLDYETAKRKSITERFPYLEFPSPGLKTIEKMPNPRLIKTHLPPSLLFGDLTESANGKQTKPTNMEHKEIEHKDDPVNRRDGPKVLLMMRNPKDVLVSYYHFSRMNNMMGYKNDFDDFYLRFTRGMVPYGPVWEHFNDCLRFYEEKTQNERQTNVLIIFYEDLKKNFTQEVDRICEFLNRPQLNDEQMAVLTEHCRFESMKNNPMVNYQSWAELGLRDPNEAEFMRRGQIGDWKSHLNEVQNRIFDNVIEEKFYKSLKFVYD